MSETDKLSLIVPLYNEEDNIAPLLRQVHDALETSPYPWEMICVDDGSTDGTVTKLNQLCGEYGDHVRIITLQRNFGQTPAMQAGIDQAAGDIIVTLDGDLQNDPRDILRLVERLRREDLDLLVGWRKNRKDDGIRKLFSRVANRLIGYVTRVRLNDYGCSLKVYRGEVIKNVRLYGDMHRFIPVWMALQTSPSRIKEEVVTHHPRQFGVSKYGLGRTFRVIFDLLSVYFFLRFLSRPAHFFGRIGLFFGGLGLVALTYLGFVKFVFGEDIGHRPLILIGVMFVVMAIQLFTTGLLGEIVSRTYYASSDHKPYVIRKRSSSGLDQESWKSADHPASSTDTSSPQKPALAS
jgi:glycosyltransferase involved in cell wall biosynthesis